MDCYNIDCAIVRGGTTKGIFLDSRQLPNDASKRNALLLALFGSPDLRQINGLGGADPLTSKVALICPSLHPNADIDYQSGEVGIDEKIINYSTMCGNLASGAALFAHALGWASPCKANTEAALRIRNINTGKFLQTTFLLENQSPKISSCERIDGVDGYGTRVTVDFQNPEGSISGRLLPTGKPQNILKVGERKLKVSIVDCGTLYTFVAAADLGLKGIEEPEVIDRNSTARKLIEEVRANAAELISSELNTKFSVRQIKIALITPIIEQPPTMTTGIDIIATVVNRFKTHKAYPVTGAICLSAAAVIPGTIVDLAISKPNKSGLVKISHPSGIIEVNSTIAAQSPLKIKSASIARSARILLRGTSCVYVAD